MEPYNVVKLDEITLKGPGHIMVQSESEQCCMQGIMELYKRYPVDGYQTSHTTPVKSKETGLWESTIQIWSCE